MSKISSPSVDRSILRRAGLVAAAVLALAGCDRVQDRPVGSVGYVKGFGGLAAADEPRAVVVARDVLSAGGSAADAAVALYFTLAVTQPSTASLGGGGVCVIHTGDRKTAKTRVYDFLSQPSEAATSSRFPAAVPAAVRGFYAMHAKHGRLRWEQLLAEPERMARFGSPVSRAFAVDLAKAAPLMVRDPAARRIFFRPDGRPLGEGDNLVQTELAVTIGRVRRAPGDMYAGPMAREMVEAAQQAGISLTMDDLKNALPQTRDTVTIGLGNDTAHFPPQPAIVADAAASLVKLAAAKPDQRDAVLSQASAQAAEAPVIMPATGFVVMDYQGGAVACGLSTQGVFGNGRILPGTGMVMAAAPGVNGGPAAVAPMLVVNHKVNEVRFGAVASGGGESPVAVASTMFAALDGHKLDQAMQRPEPPKTPQAALAPTRVNAFYCASGEPGFSTCSAGTDPRGFGLAAVVGKD